MALSTLEFRNVTRSDMWDVNEPIEHFLTGQNSPNRLPPGQRVALLHHAGTKARPALARLLALRLHKVRLGQAREEMNIVF